MFISLCISLVALSRREEGGFIPPGDSGDDYDQAGFRSEESEDS